MQTHAISVRQLTLSYGETRALDGLSFRVDPGEVYGLLGPNGAGKSTLVRVLSGLADPDAGTASIAGHDVVDSRAEARRKLGVVPQDIALYEELSARHNLSLFAGLHGLAGSERSDAIERVLAQVGLSSRASEPCGNFSGGMLRRLSIAVALVHGPRVLVMDEPTVGLDPQHRGSILDLVASLAADGMAVLYTSHYMDEVQRLATRVGVVDHGKMIAEGTVDELVGRSGHGHMLELGGIFAVDAATIASSIDGVSVVRADTARMVMRLDHAERRLAAVLQTLSAHGEVASVSMTKATLDHVFVELTGRALRD